MSTTPKHSDHKSSKKHPVNKAHTEPITEKEEVPESNDEHIDQDFPGFPHPPSREGAISNGSAGAFEGTEEGKDEDDDENDLRYK